MTHNKVKMCGLKTPPVRIPKKPRAIHIGSPEENSLFFSSLNARVYPKGSDNSTQKVKLKLKNASSLPSPKKLRPSEGKISTLPNLVAYSDDDDAGGISDYGTTTPSTNTIAVSRTQKDNSITIRLLETCKTKSNPFKTIESKTFYNKTSSPKTYKRLRDTHITSRIPPLPIRRVSSKPFLSDQNFCPFRVDEELTRNTIHREDKKHCKPQYKINKLETIDLLEYGEMNISPPPENKVESKSPEIPNRPILPSEPESEPDFNLSYDSPPPPLIEDFMEITNEMLDVFKMEILLFYFGSLSCKPLDSLQIDKDYFKLHIQFINGQNACSQLFQIQACNIESIEINRLEDNGYIFIKPKPHATIKLSKDLNLNPTQHLNDSSVNIMERSITLRFEIKQYPLDHIHHTLKVLFEFPVRLNTNDNYILLMFLLREDLAHNTIKSPTKPNSPAQLHNITLSSSDSQAFHDEILVDEEEHSYCQTRQSQNHSHRSPQVIEEYNKLSESNTDKLLTYPAVGHSRRITIYKDAVSCLLPEMFLNDTIIEFYLLYIYHELFSQKQREQVHIFNTFFYTKLTNNSSDSLSPQRISEKHGQVSNWTKNVNLFEKDFIVLPIHDHAHWFLAIICYPNLFGKDPMTRLEDESNQLIDLDSLECKSNRKKKQSEKKSCILIFDSLEIKRTTVIYNLKSYLKAEWEARYKSLGEYPFDPKNHLIGHHPKLPIQPNSSDCGLFVLQYAESFFTDPPPDFTIPIKLEKWFSLDKIQDKRNCLIKLIFDLSQNENYKQV
ncbi:Sentrin-specific protease 7 [Oopsacas minuta]|uniref:Sentrin-specific protease 7 n=1 Tax=Oopsacas minuta TaxID=111878 RepID=A0AAV7JSY6_9METZ|nr:Sentrin-specific protease 7 [Oopsacas minuta]